MISATVKTILTPVAVAKDAVNIVTGEKANATKDLLESASDTMRDSDNPYLLEGDELKRTTDARIAGKPF